MKQRMNLKFAMVFCVLFLINLFVLSAQEEEETFKIYADTSSELGASSQLQKKGRLRFDFSYYLGTDYTFALDMLLYPNVPFYQTLKVDNSPFTEGFVDALGAKGHFFRVANIFEWRREKISFSLFANLTMNYIPTFVKASVMWVPSCLHGAAACAKGIFALWAGSLEGAWMIVNLSTLFLIPIIGTVICATGCAICLLAIPLSMTLFALPMTSVAGSFDYHPYTSDLLDTKLSLGLDIDCYRGILHAGFAGLYTQAEASLNYKKLRLYSQLGYRVDVINVLATVQTKKGTVTDPCRYVPAPYIKAGVAFKLK